MMLNKNFLLITLPILLVFSFIACSMPNGSGGGSRSPMDGTWRRGNLDHYYQIKISGNKWEYSEGAAGHILGYTKGTWNSSKPQITADSNGILTLVVDQTAEGGSWKNYPEEDFNLKTNAAWYTLAANANVLTIDEPILTTAGLWSMLEGSYEKQYEWDAWSNANGDSTISLFNTSGTFAVSGNIADGDDHWAGIGIFPADKETQNAMKTAQSISFDIKGSGTYELILSTSDIQKHGDQTGEWLWYKRIFTAPATATTIKLNIEDFLQEGTYMEFKQNLWENIQFAPVWDSKGPFFLTIGNIKVSDTADGDVLPDWRWDSNKWESGTIDLKETGEIVTITGNNSGGFVDWWASPNNGKTSHALKNAPTLSFKADGSGAYQVRLRTVWGDEHSEIYYNFTLTGAEKTITLSISDFALESTMLPFDQSKTINIQFASRGNGDFNITISDLKLDNNKVESDPTPVVGDYTITGTGTFAYSSGTTRAVTVAPKAGKSTGTVTVYYTGSGSTSYAKSTTAPSAAGTYTVTFDVAAADGWNAATGLSAGTITINNPTGTTVTTWKGLAAPTATKALQYTTFDDKTDVLGISPNPKYGNSGLTYSLSAWAGKKIKIVLSVDMKLTSQSRIVWQINDFSYPLVAGNWGDGYTANTWYTIQGVYIAQAPLGTDKMLYLEGEQLGNGSGNVPAYLANFSVTVTEVQEGVNEIPLSEFNNPGWQANYCPPTLLNGTRITTGNTFIFTYSFKSDVAIDELMVQLVDNGEHNMSNGTGWGWTPLTPDVTVQKPVAAGTVYTGSVTLTATGTATDATPEANRLIFKTGEGTTSLPTLQFTTLTLTKN